MTKLVQDKRQEILDVLQSTAPATLRLHQLGKHFALSSDSPEYESLRQVLDDLVRDGLIYRSSRRRYGLVGKTEEKASDHTSFEGILAIDGYNGVVTTESLQFPRIVVKRPNLHTALHGDRVIVQLQALRKKKNNTPTGEVVQVLERGSESLVGTVEYDGDFYFLIPDDERIHVDFLIPPRRLEGAADGDKVVTRLYRWDDPLKSPEVEVVQILGRAGSSMVEFTSILHEFKLRREFPAAVESEAAKAAKTISQAEKKRRLDLRQHDVITIDPVDAKDFDDALSLEILPDGNYLLGVHIADVSHYVSESSALDTEALQRGNSTYLVDGVVPMLPEVLSNNLCSLVPHKDRLTYSVMMEFSPRGAVKRYEIRESIIHSQRRFTYEEVQQIIDGSEGDYRELLLNLHKLATILRKRRYQSGGIDFDTTEIKFILDEQKRPVEAIIKRRTDATSLVEECMLAANRTVATHIKKLSSGYRLKNPLPFLYRIHDDPNSDKLSAAIGLVQSFGIVTVMPKDLRSKDINTLIQKVAGRPESIAINQVLLRSMAKAVYSDYNIGHYGLGFEDYSHFTSPIRRYPDLIVHRLLKEYALDKPDSKRLSYLREYVPEVCDHCSDTERASTEAERASIKLTQVAIARQHVGSEFNGTVTGVTHFGIFVTIDALFAEGLVKVHDIDDDYYYYNERQFSLVGRRSKKTFRFGTRVRVRIAKVNPTKRELDYIYIGDAREDEPTPSLNEQKNTPKKPATEASKAVLEAVEEVYTLRQLLKSANRKQKKSGAAKIPTKTKASPQPSRSKKNTPPKQQRSQKRSKKR